MNTGSISIGRLAGAQVRIHWSAVLVAALLAAGMANGVGVALACVGVAVFFVSILVHELGHALVARRFGIPTSAIELWGLGGFARLDREARTPKAEGWIAAAGPLASFLLGGLGIGLALALDRAGAPNHVVAMAGWTGLINLVLAVFNLLPGAPLDGGRIVRAVRWAQHGQRYRAMREAGQAGRVIGWMLAGVGVAMLMNSRPGIWILLTGVFIAVNARAEINLAAVGERLGGVKVGDLTWFGIAETGTDMDADSMIWQRQRLGGAGAVAVRNDDGQLGGLVLEDQLWAVPSEHRPWVMLTSLMAPFSRLAQADPDDELAMVLPRLNPLRPVVTVWRDGRLLGVIPPNTLRNRLAESR
jgi:Zn-dependent protease